MQRNKKPTVELSWKIKGEKFDLLDFSPYLCIKRYAIQRWRSW